MHCGRRRRRPRGGGGARAARMRDLRVRGHGAGRRSAGGAALLAALPDAAACSGRSAATPVTGALRPRRVLHARPAYARPAATRPRYRIDGAHAAPRPGAPARSRSAFTPDLPTGRLVFRLWAERARCRRARARTWPWSDVRLGGRPAVTALPDPTTLVVRGGHTFAAGRTVHVSHALPAAAARRRARPARRPGRIRRAAGLVLPAPAVGAGRRLGHRSADHEPGRDVVVARRPTSPSACACRPGLDAIATGDPSAGGIWRAHGGARLRGRGRPVPCRDRHGARATRPCAWWSASPRGWPSRPAAVAAEVGARRGTARRAVSAPTPGPTCTSPSCPTRRPSGSSIRR